MGLQAWSMMVTEDSGTVHQRSARQPSESSHYIMPSDRKIELKDVCDLKLQDLLIPADQTSLHLPSELLYLHGVGCDLGCPAEFRTDVLTLFETRLLTQDQSLFGVMRIIV